MRGEACYAGPAQAPVGNTTVMSVCPGAQRIPAFHPRSAEVIRDAAQSATCGKQATVVLLQNGQPIQNLESTSMRQYLYFAIDVPAGQNQLEITTQGSGELILYARYGTLPTDWGTLVSFVPGTANQHIVQASPRAGRWYILLFGFNPFWGVELDAQYW